MAITGTEKQLPSDYYDYGNLTRVKFIIYQILSSLVQISLIGVGFLISGGNSKEPSLPMVLYILTVVLVGMIYGFYLLYQRSKNIGINPWIGLVLAILPIIQIFWGLGLYILPEGFWDDKKLDRAAKIWGAIIIAFFLVICVAIAVAIPALSVAINEERAKMLQGQENLNYEETPSLDENPFEQSYGLDTKGADYELTSELFERILSALKSQNPENSKLVLSEIAKTQGALNPLIIGMAANLMMQRGQTEKALFWFYAGELRTLSDLNLYKDKEIPGMFLSQYLGGNFNGGRVTALTQQNRAELEMFIENNRDAAKSQLAKALAWDKRTPKNYNRLWLGKKDSLLPSEWLAQDQKTRKKFQQSELASIGVGPVESVFKPR